MAEQRHVSIPKPFASGDAGECIWRNGPYIGGHLAFFYQIEFETLL